MKEMVRCKACGYIMEKDALGEVCPACGVKKEMFEPWEDKVGTVRRTILEIDLHPVVVHAPQALTFLLLLIGVTFPLFPADLQNAYLWPAVVVMTWLLPIALVGTILTGMFDAMVRYRKIATPALLAKQLLGYAFVVLSGIMLYFISTGTFSTLTTWLGFVIANLVAMGVSSVLGIRGAKLTKGVMPGDKIFMKKKKKPAAKVAPARVPEEKKE